MAHAGISEETFVTALATARTSDDVDQILTMAETLFGPLSWRPVGDRENNIGTIRVGSDPALGIVERVTNGIDALLDLGCLQHPDDVPASPRKAAQLWYGVPPQGIGDMTTTERRELGEKLKVWLDESGDPKRPTVVVEDRGIGQAPSSFPRTLLSLNESNKVGQTWSMGTYGQGGAVTYGFDYATIIVSRRHPDLRGEAADRVGWTIVKECETDPTLQILPSYKYVVGSDGEVLELDPCFFPDFEHGTRVTHVAYDLQGWTGPFTTAIWQFFHSALFDPVLPFLITGKRKKEKKYGSRIIIGNAARLAHPDKARGDLDIAHSDSVAFDLGARYGHVTFNYWVVRRPEGSAATSEPAGSYVRADSAVSMTLFGQRQDTESRVWVKDRAMLPFLFKNIIVQIDADGLTPVAKREVFASTRERATKSDLREMIYEHLASTLRGDDELSRLNHEEKERLLQRSTSASSEKVRKRLAKFVKTRLKNLTRPGKGGDEAGTGSRRRRRTGGGGGSGRDTGDDHLPNVPNKLVFSRKSIRVEQGASGYTWVEIDAKNGYLPAHDDTLTLSWDSENPSEKVKLAMRSKLLGGMSRWVFEAEGDAALGDYAFRASLLTPNGILADATTIMVVAPRESKPRGPGTEPETGPDVRWVYENEWPEHGGMDARTVGYVTEDQEETIIWVNRNYHRLDVALAGRNLTTEQIETRATRYQFPVACALWLQHDDLKRTEPRPADTYLKAEMERLAEAVLVAIDPDVELAGEESED